jgi:hypothetical protein
MGNAVALHDAALSRAWAVLQLDPWANHSDKH